MIDPLIRTIETLRGFDLHRASIDELQGMFKAIGPNIHMLGVERTEAQIWHRAVKADSSAGFPNLKRCIYPPADLVRRYGRCNILGAPKLYAAWNGITAVAEAGVEEGDYVQVIALRPPAGARCAMSHSRRIRALPLLGPQRSWRPCVRLASPCIRALSGAFSL